jgi:DegV family protein with EDD domain
MEVIDSKSGSVATGLIALYTAELSKEFNQSFEQLVNKVNQLVNHVEHVFCIADLSWLIKGGRISKVEGVIGNILDIKPILHVNDGALEVIKKVRGRKKSLNTILNILEERTRNMKGQIIGVSHADDIETANMLIEMIKKRLGSKDFIVTAIGSVLGSHLGIGGVGVFFFNEGAKDIIGEIKLS